MRDHLLTEPAGLLTGDMLIDHDGAILREASSFGGEVWRLETDRGVRYCWAYAVLEVARP